jgi:hypothetical protein
VDDVLLLVLPELVELALRLLPVLEFEFDLSVVELTPELPGSCGVLAGPGGAF